MAASLSTLTATSTDQRRDGDVTALESRSSAGATVHPITRLFALAFVANALDVILSWVVIRHYGLAAEANPLPFMAWGWTHGLFGAMAVKAALLAIVVATAAIQPKYARPLLGLVAVAGTLGAISALIVLK